MSPISLSTSVAGIDVCFFAHRERADCGGDGLERPHRPAHHEQRREQSDQHACAAKHDALPLVVGERAGKIVGQHAPLLGAEFAQQLGHPPDQAALGPQHFAVEVGDLAFPGRQRNDRLGIGADRAAEAWLVDGERTHALGRLFGAGRIVRQQGLGDTALRAEQRRGCGPVRGFSDRLVENLAQRRQRRDQFVAAGDQRGDALDSAAIGR